MQVVWTKAALRGLWHAFDYLSEINPRAAAHLADSLLAAGDSLVNFPLRGRPVPKTAFRELLTVPPYVIRYQIIGNEALILRVRHAAQRPTEP
jgi:plasmid stabilization system protein ParE